MQSNNLSVDPPVPDFTKLSAKEAYFEVLRVWVTQAKQQHAAVANFPYYLMANYPHLLQQPQYPIGGLQYPISNLTQQRHLVNHPDVPQQPADEAAINRLIFNYMHRNRQNQFLNNQQRNEESELRSV